VISFLIKIMEDISNNILFAFVTLSAFALVVERMAKKRGLSSNGFLGVLWLLLGFSFNIVIVILLLFIPKKKKKEIEKK